MRKLIKDAQDNVAELISINGIIPEGWIEIAEESLASEELALARRNKMSSIRSKRDSWLLKNDKEWLIKSKKQESTAALEADAQALRDLPESAQTAVDALTTVEDVQAYDAFAGLTLSQSYE